MLGFLDRKNFQGSYRSLNPKGPMRYLSRAFTFISGVFKIFFFF